MIEVLTVGHPVAKALLTEWRDVQTRPPRCRAICHSLSVFLAAQATADLATSAVRVMTPLRVAAEGVAVRDRVALVPVLRAGHHLVPGFHALIPSAHTWHLGMRRNEEPPFRSELYLDKVPNTRALVERVNTVYVLDVMLATGGSACNAIDILKSRGATRIVFVGVLAAPEGVARVRKSHPDVRIHLVEIDVRLNEIGYIVPGLGDAGDRLDNDTPDDD